MGRRADPGRYRAAARPGDLRQLQSADDRALPHRGGTEVPDYQCLREYMNNVEPRCQTSPGAIVYADVATLLLDTPPTQPRGRPYRPGRDRGLRRRGRRDAPGWCRTRPPSRRARPPPLSGRRPEQPVSRRNPGSRLERGAARPASCPGRLRQRHRRLRDAHPPTTTRPASGRGPPTSPRCGQTRSPCSASAGAWSACSLLEPSCASWMVVQDTHVDIRS